MITTFFCLAFLALPAHAQQRDLKPGLNYTTLGAQKAQPAQDTKVTPESETSESDPATIVWNKYKDLATGTAAEEETDTNSATIEKPEKPEKPEVATPSETTATGGTKMHQEPTPQSGIAMILQEWKASKEDRRSMRTKTFSTP